jgi:hypothetical protein
VNELGRDLSGTFRSSFRPTILNFESTIFDPAKLSQSLHEGGSPWARDRSSGRPHNSDGRQVRRLLRARRERPRSNRPAELTEHSLMFACSRTAWIRCTCCTISRVNCLRVRVRSRSS